MANCTETKTNIVASRPTETEILASRLKSRQQFWPGDGDETFGVEIETLRPRSKRPDQDRNRNRNFAALETAVWSPDLNTVRRQPPRGSRDSR